MDRFVADKVLVNNGKGKYFAKNNQYLSTLERIVGDVAALNPKVLGRNLVEILPFEEIDREVLISGVKRLEAAVFQFHPELAEYVRTHPKNRD